MLRLYDVHAGRLVDVRPAVPGMLRVRAAGGRRAYLVGDLLRRAAQRHGWRVAVVREGADAGDLAALNIYPAEDALPGDAADVRIVARDREGSVSAKAGRFFTITVEVEPAEVVARADDPLALRLALLAVHYRTPCEVSEPALREASATLRRWRAQVAGWAEHPSRPMCAEYVQSVYAAYDDDLDTPAALRQMHRLERDQSIPPGSKFEAFVHLDQLLGLDLARDIGARPPRPR